MERSSDRRVRIKHERSPFRLVRGIRGNVILVADEHNLTEDELAQVMEIAGRVSSVLSNNDKLFHLYKKAKEEHKWGPPSSPGDTWREIAYSMIDDYLIGTGRSYEELPRRVRIEINQDVRVVGNQIDDILQGRDSGRKFHNLYEKSKKRIVISVCSGREIAQEWIQTAVEVIQSSETGQPA